MKLTLHLFAGVVLSILASVAISHFIPFTHWWWSIIYFTILFLIIPLASRMNGDVRSKAEAVFGIVMAKCLLLLFTALLYALYDKAGLKAFSAHFMTHYILFTLSEIRYLLYTSKNS